MSSFSSLGSSYSCGPSGNSAAFSTYSSTPPRTSLQVPNTADYGDIPDDWFSGKSQRSSRSTATSVGGGGGSSLRSYAPTFSHSLGSSLQPNYEDGPNPLDSTLRSNFPRPDPRLSREAERMIDNPGVGTYLVEAARHLGRAALYGGFPKPPPVEPEEDLYQNPQGACLVVYGVDRQPRSSRHLRYDPKKDVLDTTPAKRGVQR
jgi:hypothetical protein